MPHLQDKNVGLRGEKKEIVFQNLIIKNNHLPFLDTFEDPYNGEGLKAAEEWEKYVEGLENNKHLLERVLKHNRSCLLKECYILSHRRPFPAIQYPQVY